MNRSHWTMAGVVATLALAGATGPRIDAQGDLSPFLSPINAFDRIATLDTPGVAEIVSATPDGRLLAYTDADTPGIGFVNIANPRAPQPYPLLDTSSYGSPTSVDFTKDGLYALATVAAGRDADGLHNPGMLLVIQASTRTVVHTKALGGQPDSIKVSPDGKYAAIAIENERDEDVDDGEMPQAPAGFLTIVDIGGAPAAWGLRDVALTGIASRFPEDPEPEFVDINVFNEAAVTLQENNHVVIVDLKTGDVRADWAAGSTSHTADTKNNNDISFVDSITAARREPDAIAWTPFGRLVTANEGDYNVDITAGQFIGGRDFTIFSRGGTVLYEPLDAFEREAVRHGHYPDARSASKGTEPEGAEVAVFGTTTFAFIGSERGNFVGVYELERQDTVARFVQVLPTGTSPEGIHAIPRRGLLVVSNEVEGSIGIYAGIYNPANATYPQVVSDDIPWSALSGLAPGPGDLVYAVPDNVFRPSRIWTMRLGRRTQVETVVNLNGNYDLEGIAVRPQGGFWVASEGAGTSTTKNLLLRVSSGGMVEETVELPASVNANQRSNGYEGVTTSADGSQVYVAFQREWADDPVGFVKIGRYTPATGEWRFFRYPLDGLVNPPSGAWVGLSEISRIDDSHLLIVERDNQLLSRAQVKRLYAIAIGGVTPQPAGTTPPLVSKTLVRDLLDQDGFVLEKIEGVAVRPNGEVVVVNDNDGVGETRLLRLRGLLR